MPKPTDFLSQITQIIAGAGPHPALSAGAVPPRPARRLRVSLMLQKPVTVDLEVSDEAYENGGSEFEAAVTAQLPTLLLGQVVSLADLDVADDLDMDYNTLNTDELDAWDAEYSATHDVDGTPFAHSDGALDDDGDADDGPDPDDSLDPADSLWDAPLAIPDEDFF